MKTKCFEKSDWPYYALGIQILKVQKTRVSVDNENFRGPEGRPGPQIMIIMGSKDIS